VTAVDSLRRRISGRPAGPGPGEAVPTVGGPKGLARTVAVFDAYVDRRVDRLRGDPTLDRVMYTASELGNFSLVWHLVNTTRAVGPDRRVTHAVRVAAVLGVESVLVNGPVKNMFRRHRPVWEHERPLKLRVPKTSSFPSGHASSAAVAAVMLSQHDNAWPLYWGIGAVVAASRVYVGVHHASDVVAGAVLGVAIAEGAKRLWAFPPIQRPSS
jgi:membrane-associated phospholipid phosphatase